MTFERLELLQQRRVPRKFYVLSYISIFLLNHGLIPYKYSTQATSAMYTMKYQGILHPTTITCHNKSKMASPQYESKAVLNELIGDERSGDGNTASIFVQLKMLLQAKDASLDPSPTLNFILSRLVSLLQGRSHSSFDCVQRRLFSEVQQHACREIDGNETLRKRAEFIRDVAMNAEFQLELHHVERMLSKKASSTECDPVEKLRAASDSFPYVDHYIDMVKKESEVIQRLLLARNRKGLETPTTIKCDFYRESWKRVVVFCGSGPLPFTGILMAIYLKVKIVLVDCDAQAVDFSRKLVARWEQENIMPTGVVTVTHERAEDLYFYNPDTQILCETDKKMVPCHILFIAGLISNDVKHHMVRKISELEDAGPFVVIRTAHGLTARFAYHKTCRKTITKYLSLVGIVAPETHRDRNGLVIDDHVRPIDFFPADILNSLELYSWHRNDSCPSS